MKIELTGLMCPIDGEPLVFPVEMAHAKMDAITLEKHTATGKHVHVDPLGAASCANGHTWKIAGFTIERAR